MKKQKQNQQISLCYLCTSFILKKRQNYACLPVKSQAELVYVQDIYTCRYP